MEEHLDIELNVEEDVREDIDLFSEELEAELGKTHRAKFVNRH